MIEIDCKGLNDKEIEQKIEDTQEIVLLKNYDCYEVVTIDKTNIDKLTYRGYIVDRELQEGQTYILLRKNYILYHVKPLEKLSDIAQKFCTTCSQLIEDNQLSSTKLFIGQILVIY